MIEDYADNCDYEYLRKQIAKVLRKYFEVDDSGNPNPEFNDCYSAEDAIDDIHSIIGDI